MKPVTVYLLSLGCSKNLVDSQVISGALKLNDFVIVSDPEEAQVIIINTCGFIEAAQQESIEAILELAQYKQTGACRLLLAVGCMAEKFAKDMQESMPELDACLGVGQYERVPELVNQLLGWERPLAVLPQDSFLLRDFSPGQGSAYLKIAEGCDNHCSYCLIPQLRGPYRSRPEARILTEAERLAEAGLSELVLIAQDTTGYGLDLYGQARLPGLLRQLARLPLAMIRLLYAYPDRIGDRLLQVMAEEENICKYLDIPIQHASGKILRAMNRPGDAGTLLKKLRRIRGFMPDISLRTTVIVGFPGESADDFDQLLGFLNEARFDWVGAFPYYREADTPAAAMPGQVEEAEKQERLDRLLEQAGQHTRRALTRFAGRTLTVLAEGPAEELGPGWQVGRSQFQAPEVDGCIYFQAREARPGSPCQVRITGSDQYDLSGEML